MCPTMPTTTTTTMCPTMPTTTTTTMLRLNNNKTTGYGVQLRWQHQNRNANRQDDQNSNEDIEIKRTNDDMLKSEDKFKMNSGPLVTGLRLMRISTCKLF